MPALSGMRASSTLIATRSREIALRPPACPQATTSAGRCLDSSSRNTGIAPPKTVGSCAAISRITPLTILSMLEGGGGAPAQVQQQGAHPPAQSTPQEDRSIQFIKVVLRDTEVVWGKLFQAGGATYHPPKLDVFRGSYPTG